MNTAEIIRQRLINQRIAGSSFQQPAEVVHWMLAMQAQEYAMAKWAIGLRLPGSNDGGIEQSFKSGEILRTHLMRPTWHFVTPADIRWLLQLTAPRVQLANGFVYRQNGMDKKIFNRSNDIIAKSLEGGKHLLRSELQGALKQKKIVVEGIRLTCVMMQAELDGIVCSGARRGNQQTYALLDERVASTKPIAKEEALAQFAERYFTSRGPATVRDFASWSGLTMAEVKKAAGMLPGIFVREMMNGQEYIFKPVSNTALAGMPTSFLMPDYDEYGMAYKDRTALREMPDDFKHFTGENPAFNRMIIINGKIAGTWKRTIKGAKLQIETVPFRPLSKAKQQLLKKAIQKYADFTGMKLQ